jgi:hypothetical protein
MKKEEPEHEDDMLPEYDFSNAVVGKYAERYKRGTNLARLHQDLAKDFPTSESVNAALRELLHIRENRTRYRESQTER